MLTELRVPAAAYDEMLAHLRDTYPEEGCGLMAGHGRDVLRIYPVENQLHSRVAYEMEPRQQLQAFQALEAAGLELLAIYHSHPQGPETPSTRDVAQATYPDAFWVVVSFAQPDKPAARAFVIRDWQVRECTLAIS